MSGAVSLSWGLLFITLSYSVRADYGDGRPYPISGSWFKDRTNTTDIQQALEQFKGIGGETIISNGVQFINSTKEDVRNNAHLHGCVVDGEHCVDIAEKELSVTGLRILSWATYHRGEHNTDGLIHCSGFDKKYTVGDHVYYRLVLWMEDNRSVDNCTLKNNSKVAVLFTSYAPGEGDPSQLLIQQAAAEKMSVYLGLPLPPYCKAWDQSSDDLLQAYYHMTFRIISDHQKRFKIGGAMKGYYSDVEVVPGNIFKLNSSRGGSNLPNYYIPWYWMKIATYAKPLGWKMLASPLMDLTHASNTTMEDHVNGLHTFSNIVNYITYMMRDGRGEGRTAYFKPEHKDDPIYYHDHAQWLNIKEKNSSITEQTTFSDIYYASVYDGMYDFSSNWGFPYGGNSKFLASRKKVHKMAKVIDVELWDSTPMEITKCNGGLWETTTYIIEFLGEYNRLNLSIPWLMVDAYDKHQSGEKCESKALYQTDGNKDLHRVTKKRLDKVLSDVGAMVSKVTALSFDPFFTCQGSESSTLSEEIKQDHAQPIISECSFHSPTNISVVVIGYNIDGPSAFRVNYTEKSGEKASINLGGYYYWLDYGAQMGLVDTLVYIQLWDIPNLADLADRGQISVAKVDGTGDPCIFEYDFSEWREKHPKYFREKIFSP